LFRKIGKKENKNIQRIEPSFICRLILQIYGNDYASSAAASATLVFVIALHLA